MIEKICARLEEKKAEFASVRVDYAEGLHDGYMKAIKIVQEVAKEYGKDTNVRSKEYKDGYADGFHDCIKINGIVSQCPKGE